MQAGKQLNNNSASKTHRACLAPRARNAHGVYANAAPRLLFQNVGLQFIFAHCTTRATVSHAFAAERSAGLFRLSRSNAVANARNVNPNRAIDSYSIWHTVRDISQSYVEFPRAPHYIFKLQRGLGSTKQELDTFENFWFT